MAVVDIHVMSGFSQREAVSNLSNGGCQATVERMRNSLHNHNRGHLQRGDTPVPAHKFHQRQQSLKARTPHVSSSRGKSSAPTSEQREPRTAP